MNEKLKAFLKYPNAEIIYWQDDAANILYPNLINLILSNPTDFQNVIIDCKLQLHSIEDMKENETQNMGEFLKATRHSNFLEIISDSLFHNKTKIDYLREHNYDIDGLTAKGWAERIER